MDPSPVVSAWIFPGNWRIPSSIANGRCCSDFFSEEEKAQQSSLRDLILRVSTILCGFRVFLEERFRVYEMRWDASGFGKETKGRVDFEDEEAGRGRPINSYCFSDPPTRVSRELGLGNVLHLSEAWVRRDPLSRYKCINKKKKKRKIINKR